MRATFGLLILLTACRGPAREPIRPAPSGVAELVARADRLRRRGRADEALALYREALAADLRSIRAHVGIQTLRDERGEGLAVRAEYDASTTLRPYVRARLRGPDDTRTDWIEQESEPWRSLGRGLWDASNPKRALADLQRAVALDPGLSWAQLAQVPRWRQGGALGRASVALEAAAWSDPGHPLPHIWRSSVEDRRGRLDAALEHALAGWERAPSDRRACDRVYQVARRMGRTGSARGARALARLAGSLQGIAHARAAELFDRAGEGVRADQQRRRARAAGVTRAEIEIAGERRRAPALAKFVRAFRRGVEGRYRHYIATKESERLEEFRDWARALFEKTTGRPLDAPGSIRHFSFVGALVDSTADSDEPLVRALAKEGLFLLIGQRRGGPPEALLAELVERTPQREWPVRGDTVRCEVAWIGRRLVDGYLEWAGGGDLAGLALPEIVLVDLHAAALWEAERQRKRVRWSGAASSWAKTPIVQTDDPLSVRDPAGVANRLLQTAELRFADEVLVHELAHLVDAERHLPVPRHPIRNLRLAVERGFSQREILGFLERNAQLAAIHDGPSPRQALGVCCSFLGGDDDRSGPHARGYTEIVSGFVREIARRPERYPRIDTSRVIVQQLDRLNDRQIAQIGRALADRWGLGANAQPTPLPPRASAAAIR